MKLTLEVDTTKLSDDQLEKFKTFLVAIGMYQEASDLAIPEDWTTENLLKDNIKTYKKPWWKFWKKS